jgi:hypothetical protein
MNVTTNTISELSAPSMSDALPLLEPLITIIGIAVTAILVIWQIRKQFDHSLKLQWPTIQRQIEHRALWSITQ